MAWGGVNEQPIFILRWRGCCCTGCLYMCALCINNEIFSGEDGSEETEVGEQQTVTDQWKLCTLFTYNVLCDQIWGNRGPAWQSWMYSPPAAVQSWHAVVLSHLWILLSVLPGLASAQSRLWLPLVMCSWELSSFSIILICLQGTAVHDLIW